MFDGFWDNISRYPRYFITIILGCYEFANMPLFKFNHRDRGREPGYRLIIFTIFTLMLPLESDLN